MGFEPAAVTSLLAVGLMLLLGAWLLWLDFESRVNRAFASFLFLRSGLALSNTFFILAPDDVAFWMSIRGYFSLGTTLALVYFAVAYLGPSRGWVRLARGACLALAPVIETLYAVDHCLEVCETPAGIRFGPLSLIAYVLPLAYAGMALLLARRAARAKATSQRRAAWIVSVAFLANALLDGVLAIPGWFDVVVRGMDAVYVRTGFVLGALTLYVLAVPVALAALAYLFRSIAGQPDAIQYRKRASWIAALAIASGIFVAWNPALAGVLEFAKYFVIGVWRLLLPSLVAYAVVRHQLFDLDVKLRLGVRVGGLTALFVSVFFVATEVAQDVLGDITQSPIIGILLAGSLAFFLHPLQQVADRVSRRALPASKPLESLSHHERVRLYTDQATVAWSDGTLTRRERDMLKQLQVRLGLSAHEASEGEAQAIAAISPMRGRRGPAKRTA